MSDSDYPYEPIKLFELPANYGPSWEFFLTSLELEFDELCDSEGVPAHGMTLPAKRRVLLNAASPTWYQDHVLLHELIHVVLDENGIDWLDDEREETLVSYLAPRLWGALETIGMRWPKRPKECQGLCRRAACDAEAQ